MKKFLILLFCLFICACSNSKSDKIAQVMSENDYIIIDVRTKSEYEQLHVVDALNIPYDDIDENINIDKDTVILVYCQSGNRSHMAYNVLTNLGYTVYDMGGINDVDLPKE